ncbi:hypothetical protein AB6A23_26430 [Paenibacillus tarimensis]
MGLKIRSICKLCSQEALRDSDEGELCQSCADILEFGYVSFPAYELTGGEEKHYLSRKN